MTGIGSVGGARQRVIDALERAGSQSRDGRMWVCPGHDDRTASLSLAQGELGVVLHCFAGCSAAEVCTAVGLSERDLFDAVPVRESRKDSAPIPRVEILGPPTNQQIHCLEKSKRVQRRETLEAFGIERVRCYGKDWLGIRALGDSWKLWAVEATGKARRDETGKLERKNAGPVSLVASAALLATPIAAPVARLYDVEGESDLVAAVEAGFAHAICGTGGAGSLVGHERNRDWLLALNPLEVRVIGDLDDAGQAGAERRAAWWRAQGVATRILRLPAELGNGGDVRDYLNGRVARNDAPAVEPLGAARDLERLAEQAALVAPERLEVVDADLEPVKDESADEQLTFPRSALRGTFGAVVELLRPVTGANEAHVFAATWAALAACIGRARLGSWSGRVVAPVYALCVGCTGDHKTSAMDRVADLLPGSVRRVDGVTTDAGLFDALETASGHSVLLHFDELGFLLKTAAMSGQTLDPMLNRLWNAPARLDRNLSKRNKDGGARSVERPLVSLVAGTHVETFWGYLENPDLAIASGFVNRLAPFCVERGRTLPITREPDERGAARIKAHLEALAVLEPRNVELSSDAQRLWVEYSHQHDRKILELERIEAEATKRLRDHVARLALVFATDAGCGEVGKEDLLDAIEVGAFVGASYKHLLAGRPLARGGPEREAGIEAVCRRLLAKRPRIGQSVRDLRQNWPSRSKPASPQLQRVLDGMRAAGEVESEKRAQKTVYRLLQESQSPHPAPRPSKANGRSGGVGDRFPDLREPAR